MGSVSGSRRRGEANTFKKTTHNRIWFVVLVELKLIDANFTTVFPKGFFF